MLPKWIKYHWKKVSLLVILIATALSPLGQKLYRECLSHYKDHWGEDDLEDNEAPHRLEWATHLSARQMGYKQAQAYAARFSAEGWRLPTKDDLRIYSLRELSLDPRHRGYIMSGTEIRDDGYYVLNIRNGHVFNGKGYRAYVRLVRELPITDTE